MSDAVDLPDPDGIADILVVRVSPLRLERDAALAKQVDRLSTTRVSRRLAEAVCQFLASPREVNYDKTEGWIVLREGGGLLELNFLFSTEHGNDSYKFVLSPDEGGLKYRVEQKSKYVEQPWGGGTVAPAIKERLVPVIRKHPVVWDLSERMVRVVEAGEINWDWQPDWNLDSVPIPNRDGTLADIMPPEGLPRYVVLATWEFALEEHEWASRGHRVQLLIDPREDAIVEAWEDEWYALY